MEQFGGARKELQTLVCLIGFVVNCLKQFILNIYSFIYVDEVIDMKYS